MTAKPTTINLNWFAAAYPEWMVKIDRGEYLIDKGRRAGIRIQSLDVSDLAINEDVFNGLLREVQTQVDLTGDPHA